MFREAQRDLYYSSRNLLFFFLFTLLLTLIAACEQKETTKALQIGDLAPDFTVTDMGGQPIQLKQWKGSLVILRFWSTDCKYCRADTPVFNDYFKRFKENGLKITYINSGASAREVKDFVKELSISFPVIMDQKGEIAKLYRVKAVPQTIIIDPDQKIVAAILGGVGKADLEEITAKYIH
jgi:peroxiredoxin